MNESVRNSIDALCRAERGFWSLYRGISKSFGISECTLWILYQMILMEGPVTQVALCDRLLYPRQTVNSSVSVMVRDGLVELRPIPGTRNAKEMILTEKGESLAHRTAGEVIRCETEAMGRVSMERMAQLASIQDDYLSELGEIFAAHGLSENGRRGVDG